MWLSDTSIKQPVFITMVVLAIIVLGAISYTRLSVDLFPDISMPIVAVYTTYPGAGPQEVEEKVTKPLEEALASLSGVSAVRSTSTVGSSRINVEFVMEYPIKTAAEDVRETVGRTRRRLPTDVLEPMIYRTDPSLMPIMSLAVREQDGRMRPDELRYFVENTVKPRLERASGVAAVDVSGGWQRQVQVNLQLDRLKALRIAPRQVVTALSAENVDLPGGRLIEDGRDITLRTPGQFKSMAEVGQVVLATVGSTPVRVADVATVEAGYADVETLSRLDGMPAIVLSVRKQSGTNTVRVADAVQYEVERVLRDYPNLSIVAASDQSVFVRQSTEDVMLSLVLGGILASIAVFLFFRDLRNTLVVVIGLPVIVMGTFGALYAMGLTLNMVTLLGLALSVGFLIDDAIVVRENIFRHMESGEEPAAAASRGTSEIALAVMATTFSIVAVFLPVALSSGFIGRFLREFGITVVVAVMLSLFEAFTLAPMLSAYFFRPRGAEAERPHGVMGRALARWGAVYDSLAIWYGRLLGWALSHRRLVGVFAVVVLVSTAALVPFMGVSFMASSDSGEFSMAVEMAPGTALSESDAVARRIEAVLWRYPETKSLFTTVGSGGPERLSISVKLKERGYILETQSRLRTELADLPRLSFSSGTAAFAGSAGASVLGRPIQISLRTTESLADLDRVSADLMRQLRDVPGLLDLDRSMRSSRPELQFAVDRARAADLGLNTSAIAATVRTLVAGETATVLREGGKETPVVVRLRNEDRNRADELLSLPVVSSKGTAVPLSAVVKMTEGLGPAEIERENRERRVTIGASFSGRAQGDVMRDVRAVLDSYPMPSGMAYSFGGESKMMEEAFGSLLTALGLAVIFIYMVLASQFGSFLHPFTIMLALPLSLLGAFVLLMVTGRSLDMMAMIGLILLMGLVAKNAILLVDFTNTLRRRGMGVRQALLTAGPIRLRPVLMTTFASLLGMLPIAIGIGPGAEMRAPMATAVIGGLITSTFLSLVIVPVACLTFDSMLQWLRRRPAPSGEVVP